MKLYIKAQIGQFLFCLSLGSFLFCLYFARDYYTKKSLYAFLSHHKQEIRPKDSNRESQLVQARVDDLLKEQEQTIYVQTKAKEQQITFMNLWTHQMKTPISVLELMAQDHQLDTVAVLRETQRLKNGLNLALNEARLVDGTKNDFDLTQLSLAKIVATTINAQKNYFIHHHVYPKVLIEEEITVISDEKWLAFLIEQVVINSIKYSHPQGTVLIEGTVKEGRPILTITDSGVGIPTEDLPRIKQAFFTGENGRRFGEATGMGLYLVEQVAQSLAIAVAIQSTVSQGTTVTLSFKKNS